jgi:hypothetical protein
MIRTRRKEIEDHETSPCRAASPAMEEEWISREYKTIGRRCKPQEHASPPLPLINYNASFVSTPAPR